MNPRTTFARALERRFDELVAAGRAAGLDADATDAAALEVVKREGAVALAKLQRAGLDVVNEDPGDLPHLSGRIGSSSAARPAAPGSNPEEGQHE